MTTRLLVTGAAGFIGSTYVRRLLADRTDLHITVLDRLTYAGNRANLDLAHPALDLVEGDICDTALVDRLVADADQIVHFAAESHVDRSIAGSAEFVRTNVLGTHTLLDAALRHDTDRFVHVSTDEVYGSIDEGSWPESDPLRPNSPTRRPRPPATCSPSPATAPTDSTSGSPGAPTTMAPTSIPRRSSPSSSPTSSTAAAYPSTETAATSATGCTSRTTARPSNASATAAAPARSTTSAAEPR